MNEKQILEDALHLFGMGGGNIILPNGKVAFPSPMQRKLEEDSQFELISKINFIRESCGVKVEQQTVRFRRYAKPTNH